MENGTNKVARQGPKTANTDKDTDQAFSGQMERRKSRIVKVQKKTETKKRKSKAGQEKGREESGTIYKAWKELKIF